MASLNELGVNLRERLPLPHNILIRMGVALHPDVGQPAGTWYHRGCEHRIPTPKDKRQQSDYCLFAGDTAKSGMGCIGNQCLNYRGDDSHTNVGELTWNVKVNPPPISTSEVGGVIVVRGWDSQPQGEGRQGIIFLSSDVIARPMKFGRAVRGSYETERE